jgi:hypothetical protein
MPQALFGIANPRDVPALKNGPPNGPFGFRVSAMRQGVTGTKRRAPGWICVNVADTVCAELMVSRHVCFPEQPPPHPAKMDPEAGAAVRVTTAPLLKFAEQVTPQLIDPSLLVTVPDPVPCLVTVSSRSAPLPVKLSF